MKGFKSQKISLGEKVGYSLGDAAANLVFQMMMIFQLKFRSARRYPFRPHEDPLG